MPVLASVFLDVSTVDFLEVERTAAREALVKAYVLVLVVGIGELGGKHRLCAALRETYVEEVLSLRNLFVTE